MPASAANASAAVSGHLDTRTAATEVAHALFDDLGETCDLAFIFGSFHHRAAFTESADIIRQTIHPTVTLGLTAESILGVDRELEGLAGFAVVALRLPNVDLHPWSHIPGQARTDLSDPSAVRNLIGYDSGHRATIILADPFSTPITRLLPAISGCGDGGRDVPVIGGMASGASQPGHNVLVVNDRATASGAVGVSLGGPIRLDTVVSQGCRPFADPHLVTKVHGNVVLELGGRRAADVLRESAAELGDHERSMLGKGLLVGLVINEYKDRFGRGDFLVRNVVGLDEGTGGIAVGDMPRVGQTLQFHMRDAETAAEDLQLLLDGEQLQPDPFAALLFTCNGRGERLFEEQDHDVNVIRDRLGDVPLAGFFAAGEIGPVGHRSFVHGHTASLALFRPA